MYGVGLILGAGIYVIIGDVAAVAGNAMWISFVVASVIALFTGLSYAELSSTFPKSAAEYVFAKNVFGSHFIALVVGSLIIFVAVASAATVALGFSGYLTSAFFPQFKSRIGSNSSNCGFIICQFLWYSTISVDEYYIYIYRTCRTCNYNISRILVRFTQYYKLF